MRKHRLPDNAEWKKIVDEAFLSDETHIFSENYNMKKQALRKGTVMKRNNILMNLTVAAAAFAVVAFPTGIYLTTRTSENSPAAELPSEEISVENMNNETIYALEMGWLPDGFEQQEENISGISYGNSETEAKITVLFLKNAGETPVENITYHDNIVSADNRTTDDKTIVINYNASYDEETASPENTGREIFISFNGTNYLAHLFVTDDISKDDLNKIVDEIKLVESDTETAKDYYTPDMAEVTITDGESDGEVNEAIHQFSESEDDGQVNESIHQFSEDTDYDTIYSLEYSWLPEGLEFQDKESPYGGKFHNWTTNDGMTPIFSKVAKGSEYYEDTGNPEIETTRDEWLLDGKTVSIYYRSNYNPDNPELNFGRIAFIYFDKTPYVLQLYVSDGISEEDFRKIIDNVHLAPSEEETAGTYNYKEIEKMLTEYRSGMENTEFTTGSLERLGIKADSLPVVQVGEPVQEIYPDSWGEVSATVTGVRFDDDFNGITTDGRGWEADYSEYLNEDGTLTENVRRWVKFENGTETEFATETVPVSVMTVSITYTNNGDTPVNDYCVCPTLQTSFDGYFFRQRICDIIKMETEISANNIDCIDTFRPFNADNLQFAFSCPNQSSQNNINLDVGESTEVMLSFIVEDKYRDNLYLSINDNGFVNLSNLE